MRQRLHITLASTLALALCVAGCLGTASPPHRPASRSAARGAVASAEPTATAAGLGILRAGGNAVDAAVAVALALAVVHPQAGNLGGGGFALVKSGERVEALDFREIAPAASGAGMYLDIRGQTRPEASLIGPLAAGVPGSPAGLFELHRRHGSLPWPAVVAPALRLARDGFTVTPRLQAALEQHRDTLARFPETAALWLPDGKPLAAGTVLRLPDLAATLEAYAVRGPPALMTGTIAAAVEAASSAHGGILTVRDLASYRSVWRGALRFRAFDWDIASMPLPSSGGLILAQSLAMLERLGVDEVSGDSADWNHLLVETCRRAFADRFLLGDPAHTRAGEANLLDAAWIASRAAGIDPRRATPSRDVHPWPGDARSQEASAMRPAATTHLSVADGSGMSVSLTTTLNEWFGCGLYVPGAGYFLNDEMDDFATAPGTPNLYGLVQGDANAIRPGARMLSSMSPVVAWGRGETIALGSRGGSRIPTVILQVLLRLMLENGSLQEAVDHPRIHHQWLPDEIVVEADALGPGVLAELERRGHRVRTADGLGEVAAVRILPDGHLEAAADRRNPGGSGVLPP